MNVNDANNLLEQSLKVVRQKYWDCCRVPDGRRSIMAYERYISAWKDHVKILSIVDSISGCL